MTAKIFNNILVHTLPSGNMATYLRYNADSASVYADRRSINGGADGTDISGAFLLTSPNTGTAEDEFLVQNVCSISGEEKFAIIQHVSNTTAGAGTAPTRMETVGKYVPSPDADITEASGNNTGGSGDFAASSNLSALGTN